MKTTIKLFLGISLCLLYYNCNNSSTTDNTKESVVETTPSEETSAGKVITVTYQGAAVYAGSVEYAFEDQEGELLLISTASPGEESDIVLPDNMLEEDSEELEGPPGENPELVGKAFKIYYGPDDQVTKIELAE